MLQFDSSVSNFTRYFISDGFDVSGIPQFKEKIKPGGEQVKEKLFFPLHISSSSDMERIFHHFHGFDGIIGGSKIEIDLNWLLPYADTLMVYEHGKTKNIKKISAFHQLKYLSLEKCDALDLSQLDNLVEIIPAYVDFSNFKFPSFSKICHFRFIYCRNVSCIPINENTPLRFLHFMWDRDTTSLSFIKEAKSLEMVSLFRTSQLSDWPDSSKLINLKYVTCTNTNKLFDLTGLAKAPALESLNLGTKDLMPHHLEPLQDCKSLKYIGYYASKDKIALAKQILKGVVFNEERPVESCPAYVPFEG